MEIGIDSFVSRLVQNSPTPLDGMEAMYLFLERIERADQVGLDVYGVGEHHRAEHLDSARRCYWRRRRCARSASASRVR